MRKPVILVTGARGEVGYGLIERFAQDADKEVVALDLRELDDELRNQCSAAIVGDILDNNLLQRLVSEFEIHAIYHLAALLSTRAEYSPDIAHSVNVEG
ncbi:MAG: NAD-dependent epimerase/dehydratase family protein, partial [FCB group bacterium]|nr:NAD-dependent epimerase/dehydratase family protein [FCB group bacterium]